METLVLAVILTVPAATPAMAQCSNGTQQVITTDAYGVDSVYATDLDGDGNRCVGGTQGSVVRMFPFAQADGGGVLHHALDNTLPVHAPVAAGATLNFQAWFRDPLGFTGFNLSDGLSVTFAP